MDILLWTVTATGGIAVLAVVARTVARDGYGGTPAPRSHHDPWCAGASDGQGGPCACR